MGIIVRVERSLPLQYPRSIRRPLHEDVENSGPSEYDLEQVKLWRHCNQQYGGVRYLEIYECLRNYDLLKYCLSLRDGAAIIQMGLTVFDQCFPGQSLLLWGSVAEGFSGRRIVPSLTRFGGGIRVNCYCLEEGISNITTPAAHH